MENISFVLYSDIMHEAENGMIDISESEWPSFLYPLGSTPDVEDNQLDLFRGYLLIRVSVSCFNIGKALHKSNLQVFRQIFTGPRSALKPESGKKGRSCKARLHNLTEVTGRTIAYVCIIVNFLILEIFSDTNLRLRLVLHYVV
jgi:hypothetical protein